VKYGAQHAVPKTANFTGSGRIADVPIRKSSSQDRLRAGHRTGVVQKAAKIHGTSTADGRFGQKA
jgi:hypothetical protein